MPCPNMPCCVVPCCVVPCCAVLLAVQTTILEITSGNTGIGLATVGLLRGYKVKVVIPEYYSVERRITLLALGAEIVVTAADKGVPVSASQMRGLHVCTPQSLGHGVTCGPLLPLSRAKTNKLWVPPPS